MSRISPKKLLQRSITILLLAPLIVGVILFDMQPYGALPFLVFIISITVMSLNEYFHMSHTDNEPFFLTGHVLCVGLVLLAFFREAAPFWNSGIIKIVTGLILVFFLTELNLKKMFKPSNKLYVSIKGVLYIGWFYSYFILIRNLKYGKELIFYVMFTIWSLDIMAYLVGMTIGKHRLSPEISPKKSIEGAIGGFVAAIVMSFLLISGYVHQFLPSKIGYYLSAHVGIGHSIILGAIIGLLGQSGDLYESLIKRTYKVKDSSNILPGHGGIMDRADSFILLAPVVYYYLAALIV
ncbi:MAG: hypothetical protein A2Y40_02745 [Candidatus Margulisbacteria bacterium GWF2_35_9]|nr:MAG: hypothetical protein A2Y40_02745 [Candidatus Margulisbacteria bacterium GWF2_35_9]